jgi:hypothetical protein
MKKLTKILSLVLVFAMLALAFASCGVTAEEKVAAAMAKMATAKKTDCTASVTIKMDMGGVKVEMPMTMVMKTDLSDAANPIVYTEMSMTVFGETTETTTFYKDGYFYTEAYGQKVKVAMSYEEMMEDNEMGIDTSEIFASKKDKVDESFVITENEDGTITVKMTVTKAEFASLLPDFSESMGSLIGEDGNVEINDTVFEFKIDKDGNVTDLNTNMGLSMTVEGVKATVDYDMDFTYNTVGEDFEITLPSDLDKYKTVS